MYISIAACCDLLLADRVLGILAPDHAIAPFEQLVTILVRHAQHLRDHLQRKLGRDVGHEIAIALFERPLEDLVTISRMCVLQRVDHARREAAIHQRAVARVVGRVHREHHATLRRICRPPPPRPRAATTPPRDCSDEYVTPSRPTSTTSS